ncbi:MAG: hypothetical protein JWQ40_2738, partial [Segetibacter sp.]|nr:hypothetical protein [Segetibacter sp.]
SDEHKNPRKSFDKAGTYPVKLTAVNDIGCFADTTIQVVQAPLPLAKFGFSGSNCAIGTTTFADSSTISEGKIAQWNWNFGDGDTLSNTTSAAFTKALSPGTYHVTLQTESNIGCKSIVFTKPLTIDASPKVSFSKLAGVCLNDKARMVTEARETTGISGTFSFSGKGISATGLFDPAKAGAGQFAIGYVYTSIAGCKDSCTQTITVSENPIIKLKSEVVVYKGESVTLEPSLSLNASKYNWAPYTYLDDTSSKSARSTPKESLSYKLTATGNAGCTAEGSVFIKLLKGPNMLTLTNPYAQVNAPVTCKNNPFQFSLYLPYKPTSLVWDFQNNPNLSPAHQVSRNNILPDSTVTTDGQKIYLYKLPIVYQFKETGTYPVKIIANKRSADGSNEEHEINYDVEVIAPPVAKFTFSSTGCVKDTAVFYDASSGNDRAVVKWQWQFNDGTRDEHKNPRKSFAEPGTYPVKLTAINDIGCFASTTVPFTQTARPFAKFGFSGSSCANSAITFIDSSATGFGNIAKWNWNLGNGDTITKTSAQQFKKTYPAGTFNVSLQTESKSGCKSSTENKWITLQAAPKVVFTVMPGVCISDKERAIKEASETTGIAGSFSFSGKGVSPSGTFNPSIAGAGTTTLQYLYTSRNGCTDSARQTITVSQNPVVEPNTRLVVLEGQSVLLGRQNLNSNEKYSWSPGKYLDNPRVHNPYSTPKEDITYRETVTSAEGCKAFRDVTISLVKAPIIPNAFSPNGDGINDVWNISSLNLNPACTVEVFNRYGNPVFISYGYQKPWDGTYKGNTLPVGVYYYIINLKTITKVYSGSLTLLK